MLMTAGWTHIEQQAKQQVYVRACPGDTCAFWLTEGRGGDLLLAHGEVEPPCREPIDRLPAPVRHSHDVSAWLREHMDRLHPDAGWLT